MVLISTLEKSCCARASDSINTAVRRVIEVFMVRLAPFVTGRTFEGNPGQVREVREDNPASRTDVPIVPDMATHDGFHDNDFAAFRPFLREISGASSRVAPMTCWPWPASARSSEPCNLLWSVR